jgi:hypothetical protein
MKKIATLALLASLSLSALAGEEFGGVKFHPTVEKDQISSLKNDLRYLYQNPVSTADKEFLATAQLNVGDGPNMHNWLLNRIRYIYGEKFSFEQKDMILVPGKFPATPLPDLPEPEETDKPKSFNDNEEPRAVTVMSNVGGAFYLMGKMNKLFIGFKFDNEKIYVKSPRTGLLQVGEGLFLPRFLFNKDVNHPSNSISRMATLFHEARHSDGNGKHTGFLHAKCPAGHNLAGEYACEGSANGPYTVGGLSQRHLLVSCTACSVAEKAALSAGVADSFGRIIELPAKLKSSDADQMINIYQTIASTYETMMEIAKSDKEKAQYASEIAKLKTEIARLQTEKGLLGVNVKPEKLDPTPEGIFTPVTLQESMKAMQRSLNK